MVLGPVVNPASGPDTALSPDTGPSPGTAMVPVTRSGPDMTGHRAVLVRGTLPTPDMTGHGTVMVQGTPPSPDMMHHDTGPDMTGHAIVTLPDVITDLVVMPPDPPLGQDMMKNHVTVISPAPPITGQGMVSCLKSTRV